MFIISQTSLHFQSPLNPFYSVYPDLGQLASIRTQQKNRIADCFDSNSHSVTLHALKDYLTDGCEPCEFLCRLSLEFS